VFTQKAESLAHISAGQRPAYGTHNKLKAVSLVEHGRFRVLPCAVIHKAFSLESSRISFRRALPCANMRKAFSLLCEHALGDTGGGISFRPLGPLRPLPIAITLSG